jgi:hypothetical protein
MKTAEKTSTNEQYRRMKRKGLERVSRPPIVVAIDHDGYEPHQINQGCCGRKMRKEKNKGEFKRIHSCFSSRWRYVWFTSKCMSVASWWYSAPSAKSLHFRIQSLTCFDS